MVYTVNTLSTMADEHAKDILELKDTVKDIQNDVKGMEAQMAEMQNTLNMIVVRLPPLESSSAVHQPPLQDKEDSQENPPPQYSHSVQGAGSSQQFQHEVIPPKRNHEE